MFFSCSYPPSFWVFLILVRLLQCVLWHHKEPPHAVSSWGLLEELGSWFSLWCWAEIASACIPEDCLSVIIRIYIYYIIYYILYIIYYVLCIIHYIVLYYYITYYILYIIYYIVYIIYYIYYIVYIIYYISYIIIILYIIYYVLYIIYYILFVIYHIYYRKTFEDPGWDRYETGMSPNAGLTCISYQFTYTCRRAARCLVRLQDHVDSPSKDTGGFATCYHRLAVTHSPEAEEEWDASKFIYCNFQIPRHRPVPHRESRHWIGLGCQEM